MPIQKTIILLLLVLLTANVGGRAQSAGYDRRQERWKQKQERKKIRQERREMRYRDQYPPAEDNSPAKTVKSPDAPFRYLPSVKKSRYRMDIFAAIYLDELVKSKAATFKDKIPDKAVAGVSFYEGVSIAADSLKRAGFSIDIYVHDATSAGESPETMIKSGGLDSTDIIIGALPVEYLPALADFAKKRKINFVSASAPADAGIRGNKYFTMLRPTLQTHCDWILNDITRRYPGTRVSLLYRTSTDADNAAFSCLTKGERINFRQMQCNGKITRAALSDLFDTTHPNIVVVSTLDARFADSLLKKISAYFPRVHFEVYGMPTWSAIPGLRKDDAFPNLSINITSAFSAEPDNPVTKHVTRAYKDNYGGKASEQVLQGYEITFWYANLLKAYGVLFDENYADIHYAPFTLFKVKPQRDSDGHVLYNENKHIYLSRYEGGNIKTR